MIRRIMIADAGGTKTEAALVIATESNFRIAARCRGKSGNPRRINSKEAYDNVCLCLIELLEKLNFAPHQVDNAVVGMAGSGDEQVRINAEQFIKSKVELSNVTVLPDYEFVIPQQNSIGSVALISGTGSIAVGRKNGHFHRAGGQLHNDIGSGSWICHEIADLIVANNFSAPTLIDGLANVLNLSNADAKNLCRSLHNRTSTLAGIAEYVLSLHNTEPLSRQTAASAGAGLAGLIEEVVSNLALDPAKYQLNLGGSILTKCDYVRAYLFDALTQKKIYPAKVEIIYDPIVNAVGLALNM